MADKDFDRGDFVMEYGGKLIERGQADLVEKSYELEQEAGCFMFYFSQGSRRYCVDATEETMMLGRICNHSCKKYNIIPKIFMLDQEPRLVLYAARHICPGEELLFDYGDRARQSLLSHHWLGN